MSQPSNGFYTISPLVAEESFVSRFVIEDRSLLPKRVVLISNLDQAQKWLIEKISDGRYRLKISSAVVAPVNDHIFAHLLEAEGNTEWELEPSSQHGPGVFAVKMADGSGKGWVLPDTEEMTQLSHGPLTSQPTSSPNELFKFRQCEE